MNGVARPMSFFGRAPGGLVVLWLICVAMGGAAVLVATVSGASGGTVAAGWHAGFATLASALLLPLPFLTLDQLRAQRRVWLGRVAPLAAWQQALYDHRRMLLLSWALAALPLLVLRLLTRPADEAWAATALAALWPAALLAGLMGLGLLLAAALAGLLAWPWGLAAGGALMALVVPGADGVPAAAVPQLGAHFGPPAAGLLFGTALMALLAATASLASHLVHGRLAQVPDTTLLKPGPVQRLTQRWAQFSERWRRVDGRANAGLIVSAGSQLPNNLANPNADVHFFQAWGSTVTPMHGLRLALLTVVAALLLRGALLHWRVLLAPGGRFRRDIGLRVVGSTLVSLLAYVAMYLGIVALLFALLPFLPAVPWQRLPALAFSHGLPLLADLALAVALAAWLRGLLGGPTRVIAWLCGAALVLAAAVFVLAPLLGVEGAASAVLWTRGPAHHAAQLALAALFTVLAQRAWARADLGELARRPPTLRRGDVDHY